mgnify:CR=1 FL=1
MTYYRNFEYKEQIFEKHMDYLFRCYHQEVAARGSHGSYIRYENILLGFEFFQKHAEILKCVIANNMGEHLRAAIIKNELDLSLNSNVNVRDRYLTIVYANALYGVIVSWIQDDMRDDPDVLAKLLCDIFQTKIKRF